MNGARGEPCAKTRMTPRKAMRRRMGSNHHFFLTWRNIQRSRKMESLLMSDQSIDEGGKRRALCKNEKKTKENHYEKNRQKPPLFPHAHELPQFRENLQFTHVGYCTQAKVALPVGTSIVAVYGWCRCRDTPSASNPKRPICRPVRRRRRPESEIFVVVLSV